MDGRDQPTTMTEGQPAGVGTCPICGVGTPEHPKFDCGLCGFPPGYVEEVPDA